MVRDSGICPDWSLIACIMFKEKDENITDSDHVSQLLAPIITSQRVMAAQFSNTYTSMQCKDNTTIVFDEVSEKKSILGTLTLLCPGCLCTAPFNRTSLTMTR